MPNHVSHKIIFDATHSEKVFAECCSEKGFDFNRLIPQPLQMYHGDLAREDDEDFKCNWNTWNRENWGTKWNAYNGIQKIEGDKAVILFDTAWSIPYPVLAAFANKFGIPFEHRYYDEGGNFWGIEMWAEEREHIVRVKKQQNNPDDEAPLCLELKGYDPTEEEEDGHG